MQKYAEVHLYISTNSDPNASESPDKVGQVSVWTVDGTKTGQDGHQCHPNHPNTANALLYGKNTCKQSHTAHELLN